METRNYWEENGHSSGKYENFNSNDGFGRPGELNFAAGSEDEAEYPPSSAYLKKGKVSRQDPMSHRIIEKRRRDRMNNCLADLSRLVPPEYLKKGRGRVEKTEIIEMAIRHIKFLQDRANERSDGFLSGYQEASAEAVRYLVEIQGYGPSDGLCVQMAAHLRRNCDHFNKVEPRPQARLHNHNHTHQSHSHVAPSGSSSETTSSSGGSSLSHGYGAKTVIQAPPGPPQAHRLETYESERAEPYAMDCDRSDQGYFDVVSTSQIPLSSEKDTPEEEEPLPLDGRRKCEPALRAIRKPEHTNGGDDFLQSYKFKNSIERRFSRSQDEAADMLARNSHPHARTTNYHKRRRAIKLAPSTSTSNSGSTEEARDTSPQDTSSESPHHNHTYEKPAASQFVPIFALNAHGKYYVPLSVDYACIARYLGPGYDILDARAAHAAGPVHPVTIHVNFQPLQYHHVKREPINREWK